MVVGVTRVAIGIYLCRTGDDADAVRSLIIYLKAALHVGQEPSPLHDVNHRTSTTTRAMARYCR
jgi:hypothetical protein